MYRNAERKFWLYSISGSQTCTNHLHTLTKAGSEFFSLKASMKEMQQRYYSSQRVCVFVLLVTLGPFLSCYLPPCHSGALFCIWLCLDIFHMHHTKFLSCSNVSFLIPHPRLLQWGLSWYVLYSHSLTLSFQSPFQVFIWSFSRCFSYVIQRSGFGSFYILSCRSCACLMVHFYHLL